MRRSSVESYRERIAEKVEAAHAVLAREVAALVSGEDWVRYLSFQARLHAYSANNVMLIAAQHALAFSEGRVAAPEPSMVAGFNTWKALGRWVDKGQRGYIVLAPVHRLRRIAVDETGSIRRLGRSDVPGDGEIEQRRPMLRGFTVEYVFDVSQTSGAEVPIPPTPTLLTGHAPLGLREVVTRLIEERGFSVETVPDASVLGGANGITRWGERTVMVRSDMDDAAQVKTLIHEVAHVLLHEGPPGRYLPRTLKEVEAESVAFVVSAVHGMATDDYSFPYVASWAAEDVGAAVAHTQARVAGAAKTIIAVSPAEHVAGGKVSGAESAGAEKQRAASRQRAPRSPAPQVEPPASILRYGPELA